LGRNGSRRAEDTLGSVGALSLDPNAGRALRPPPPPGGPAVYREHDRDQNHSVPDPAAPNAVAPAPPQPTAGTVTPDSPTGPPLQHAPAAPAAAGPADQSFRAPVFARPPGDAPMPLAGPARAPADPEGVHALPAALLRAARRTWTSLPQADADAAVDAGVLAAATAAADHAGQDSLAHLDSGPAGPVGDQLIGPALDQARVSAADVGAAAAALQRQGLPPTVARPVDWSEFGVVIPVLAAEAGAGASVAATVIADALQLADRSVLLVDPADPPRSGLTMAARSQGPWRAEPHPHVHIRFSWRAQALLARLETDLPVFAPGMVPPPRFWRPPTGRPTATVVDLGHDPWRVAANPVLGAGAWLRPGDPVVRPVLVVRPSRPSLLHAEQLLARLETWIALGVVTPPAQLLVTGAKRWPAGVAGAAGRRVSALLEHAVFLPLEPELAAAGITAEVTPPRLRQAIAPVLRRFDLAGQQAGHHARRGRT
jgi:hypothetical protein